MRIRIQVIVFLGLALTSGMAASKPHVIAFGKWTSVQLLSGTAQEQSVELKIRPLYVDGVVKAYTFGITHDITDRLFAVHRVIRVNDALPSDKATTPQWVWLRSGWMIVDRVNGHITAANLPEFDADYSAANWYRDYIAYCGISQDGRKLYAMVVQMGRRKPLLKKPVAEIASGDSPECDEPNWQRQPARVTFAFKPDQRLTYTVRGTAMEMNDDNDEDDEGKE